MELGLRRGNELTTVLNHLPPAPPLPTVSSHSLSLPVSLTLLTSLALRRVTFELSAAISGSDPEAAS